MSPRRLAFTSVFLACVTAGAVAGAVRALPLEIPVLAQTAAAARLEIRLAERVPAPGLSEAVVPGSGDRLYLHPPLATGEHVATARVVDGNQGRVVEVTFTAQAASRLRAATQGHVGKPVAVVIDGRVVAAPVLRDPIEGSAMISGITPEEAEALVGSLTAASNASGAVYAIGPGVSPPVPLTMQKPSYTPQAMRERLQGTVTLSAVVRADGAVDDVQVVESLDTTYGLDEQAIAALKDWRFRPGTRNGQPVAVRIMMEMEFTLRGSPRQ